MLVTKWLGRDDQRISLGKDGSGPIPGVSPCTESSMTVYNSNRWLYQCCYTDALVMVLRQSYLGIKKLAVHMNMLQD